MADDLVGVIKASVNASKKLGKPFGALGHLFHRGHAQPVPTPEQVQAEIPQGPADSGDLMGSLSGLDQSPIDQPPMAEEGLDSQPLESQGLGNGDGGLISANPEPMPPFPQPMSHPVAQQVSHQTAPTSPHHAPTSGLLQALLAQQMMQMGMGQLPRPVPPDPSMPHIGPPPQPTIGPGQQASIGPVQPRMTPDFSMK